MGSSPIRLRVIHEHGIGKAVRTFPWPSVLELRVLITLEPETVERLLSSRPQSGTSPSAMTHHDLDSSIRFPFHHFLCPPFHLHHFCTNTIEPQTLGARIRLSRSVRIWNRTALAPGKYSSGPYLFITLCSHTAHLVCQRALFLTLLSRTSAAQPS